VPSHILSSTHTSFKVISSLLLSSPLLSSNTFPRPHFLPRLQLHRLLDPPSSILENRPSTFNLQSSIFDLQTQSLTFDRRPSTFHLRPSTFDLRPSTMTGASHNPHVRDDGKRERDYTINSTGAGSLPLSQQFLVEHHQLLSSRYATAWSSSAGCAIDPDPVARTRARLSIIRLVYNLSLSTFSRIYKMTSTISAFGRGTGG
jgi:hypothetical protein